MATTEKGIYLGNSVYLDITNPYMIEIYTCNFDGEKKNLIYLEPSVVIALMRTLRHQGEEE